MNYTQTSFNLSVFLPTIRTHLLYDWYKSLELSCQNHSFEVVLVGPFQPDDTVLSLPNVKWIQDYGSPTRCAQIALLECTGDFVYHVVDDTIFEPHAVDTILNKAFDYMNNEKPTIFGMDYTEGIDFTGELQQDHYYLAGVHYQCTFINPVWGMNCHFLTDREGILSFGGFNAMKYDYLNSACHDLQFRMQANGYIFERAGFIISKNNWMPNETGDHAPIHHATISDDKILKHEWNQQIDFVIDLNNWEQTPNVWSKRFNQKYEKYQDLPIGK